MSPLEFNNQFDILWNNITSNQAPGLNDYEKSVFLTKAQDEILKSYFNPRLNKTQEGFDGNEKRQIDFSMIMKTIVIPASSFTDSLLDARQNNKRASLPSDIMMVVNEFLDVTRPQHSREVRLVVVPLDYSALAASVNKPYKRPSQYQAWRVIDNVNGNEAELIPGANDVIVRYTLRYVRRPYPIILSELTDEDVSIEGRNLTYPRYADIAYSYTTEQGCELDPSLHEEILQRAVEMAKAAWEGSLTSQLALGTNSMTNIGMVSTGNNRQQ